MSKTCDNGKWIFFIPLSITHMYAVNVDGNEMTIGDEFELILVSLRIFCHNLRLKILNQTQSHPKKITFKFLPKPNKAETTKLILFQI